LRGNGVFGGRKIRSYGLCLLTVLVCFFSRIGRFPVGTGNGNDEFLMFVSKSEIAESIPPSIRDLYHRLSIFSYHQNI
jgi:hypothetical protein